MPAPRIAQRAPPVEIQHSGEGIRNLSDARASHSAHTVSIRSGDGERLDNEDGPASRGVERFSCPTGPAIPKAWCAIGMRAVGVLFGRDPYPGNRTAPQSIPIPHGEHAGRPTTSGIFTSLGLYPTSAEGDATRAPRHAWRSARVRESVVPRVLRVQRTRGGSPDLPPFLVDRRAGCRTRATLPRPRSVPSMSSRIGTCVLDALRMHKSCGPGAIRPQVCPGPTIGPARQSRCSAHAPRPRRGPPRPPAVDPLCR